MERWRERVEEGGRQERGGEERRRGGRGRSGGSGSGLVGKEKKTETVGGCQPHRLAPSSPGRPPLNIRLISK